MGSRESPSGKPEALKLVGSCVALILTAKLFPRTAWREVGIVIRGPAMRIWMLMLAVPLLPVAVTVTTNIPLACAVPLITPVIAFIVRPGGRPVAPKLVGLLSAET